MLTKKLLRREIYVVSVPSATLIYAPLTRHFVLYKGRVALADVETDWLKEATDLENVPSFIREKGFAVDSKKMRLRLNITTNCNLQCEYCSVNAGGKKSKNMSKKIARRAVIEFCNLAKSRGTKELEISFSGGEPTLRISFIEQLVYMAQQELDNSQVKLSLRLITNGLFPRQEFSSIAGLMKEVQVSWDGPADKSPRYSNRTDLANAVWDSIEFLLSQKVPVSVLTVVSSANYRHLREIVGDLYNIGMRKLFLALEDDVGRSSSRPIDIDYSELEDIYFNLWRAYKNQGIEVSFGGTDIHAISPYPCGVPIPNYSVAPDGLISACTITFNDRSQFAETFSIGSVNENSLWIKESAIRKLRGLHVLNMKECRECFAKWHCRGGCMYAKPNNRLGSLSPERCKMIKNIVARKLLYVILEE